MKKLQLFALLLFFCNAILAQEYTKIDNVLHEFYYNYNFQPDSTNVGKQKSQAMVLQVGKIHAYFTPVANLKSDSVSFSLKDMDKQVAFNKIMPQLSGVSLFCNYRILKNYPKKGEYELFGNFTGDISLRECGKLKFNWQLNTTAKDTTILGYRCCKATCHLAGRDYVAWYTPDIPISNGPYKFSGLPGLILSVADTKNQHSFHIYKIKDRVKREMFLWLQKERYKSTTPQNYVRSYYLSKANFAKEFLGTNSKIKFRNEAVKARILHKINSENNYIEKYPK